MSVKAPKALMSDGSSNPLLNIVLTHSCFADKPTKIKNIIDVLKI